MEEKAKTILLSMRILPMFQTPETIKVIQDQTTVLGLVLSFLAGLIIPSFAFLKWMLPYLERRKKRAMEALQKQKELDMLKEAKENADYNFTATVIHEQEKFTFPDFMKIHQRIERMFAETKAEAFYIIQATHQNDKWCISVIFEEHRGIPKITGTTEYVELEVDEQGQAELELLLSTGVSRHRTDNRLDSVFRRISLSDGFEEAWKFLLNKKDNPKVGKRLTFCSICTRDKDGFSETDGLVITFAVNHIKSIVQRSENKIHNTL